MKRIQVLSVIALAGVLAFLTPTTYANTITSTDIIAISKGSTGSGNGTLDLIMFWEGGGVGVSENSAGSFDGDDANTDLPTGGGSGSSSYAESYVTTAGEIQDFYDLNFGANTVDEIVLFLDLNETGPGAPSNTLSLMDVILNPTGVPNPAGDVSSASQNGINQSYTPGTTLASLDMAYNLPLNAQGAGFADYAIFTGINPYNLTASDVLLFNQTIFLLNNGGETKFLSGTYQGDDIVPEPGPGPGVPIPEPATMLLLGTGLVGVAGAARRRNRKKV